MSGSLAKKEKNENRGPLEGGVRGTHTHASPKRRVGVTVILDSNEHASS